MKKLLLASIFSFCSLLAFAQLVDYTAKDVVPEYTDYFRPGANMGYFPPYGDKDLANIAAGNPALGIPGAGIKALRPGLYDSFTSIWGYDSRVDTYQHFHDLGLRDLTCIVGFPADWHREHWVHCSDGVTESEMFANIYTDIWDNGENGTPYNDDNYYAAYLYEVVSRYKDYIKFWEIWNEPGFDYTGARGWLPEGWEGNWWENDPDPCDYKLRAPVQFYVRTLRISWEIIKTLDPDSYVVMAGVGFPSFLDAVLRNTDNIDGGQITPDFPHRGGAYFDVMGFHSYPDIDGSVRYWSNEIADFVYTRHSDAAVKGIKNRKNAYQSVLDNYGYDGETYPTKEWIITEINIPRQAFNANSMGGQEAQINFMLKAFVKAMENDIRQMHVYNLVDIETEEDAGYEYDLMGLYKNVDGTQPYTTLQMNPEGVAYKTASDILFGTRYDELRTAAMNLPEGTDGGAFRNEDDTYTYVIWATTSIDGSEEASASYSFPISWNVAALDKRTWGFSQNGFINAISSQNIDLTAEPVFLTEQEISVLPLTANFSANNSVGCSPMTVNFTDVSLPNIIEWQWTFPGGNPASSTEKNPEVEYSTPGTYEVMLEVSNGIETVETTQAAYIQVNSTPTANFTLASDVLNLTLSNSSTNASSYFWDFGDGNTSTEANPEHTYEIDGSYIVSLTATNSCGSISVTEIAQIQSLFAPEASFSASAAGGCAPLEIQFTDESINAPDTWLWLFSGGNPTTSTEANPIVTFTEEGTYTVILQASNAAGNNTLIEEQYIVVSAAPTANFAVSTTDNTITTDNNSVNATTYLWDFGDGNTSEEANPSYEYSDNGTYTLSLTAENECSSVTTTQTVVIATAVAPTANFSTDINLGCAPMAVQFTDESGFEPTDWSWFFEGGTPSTSSVQNPTVSYEVPGVYEVTLFVSNTAGNDVVSQNSVIEVIAEPLASFGTDISNSTVVFNTIDQTGMSYAWDFGDGNTSTETNPEHTYLEDGEYEVSLTMENDCGAISSVQTLQISGSAAPQAAFSYDVNTGCAPLEVQFMDDSSLNPDSYLWIFEGGTPATSMEQNPTVTYDAIGVYKVTLSVSNGAGTDVLTQVSLIEVYDNPLAEFTSFVLGDSAVFNNMSTLDGDYLWDFGDGATSDVLHPMHIYTADGEYEVNLTVSNPCGEATFTETINVFGTSIPNAAFSSDINSGCLPLEIQFTDESSLNPSSWSWLFPGGTPAMSNAQNPVVVYDVAGNYEVTLSVSNASGNDVLTQTSFINVMDEPVASFDFEMQGDTVVFMNTTTGNPDIIWDFGDGTTSNEINPKHIYTQSGTYGVTIAVINDCGSDFYFENITIETTSAADVLLNQSINLYPNPNDGAFSIAIENDQLEQIELRLYNIVGQRLYQKTFDKNQTKWTQALDFDLPSGTYLIQIKTEEATATRRIVVKR